MSRVSAGQRFTASRPCPVCGGAEIAPRGVGRLCNGYVSHDGRYAYCSLEEFSGDLPLYADTGPMRTSSRACAGAARRTARPLPPRPSNGREGALYSGDLVSQ